MHHLSSEALQCANVRLRADVTASKRFCYRRMATHSRPFQNPSDIYRAGAKGRGQLIYILIRPNTTAINTKKNSN